MENSKKTIITAVIIFVLVALGSAQLFTYLKNRDKTDIDPIITDTSLLPNPGEKSVKTDNSGKNVKDETNIKPNKTIASPEINSEKVDETPITPQDAPQASANASGDETSTSLSIGKNSSASAAAASSSGNSSFSIFTNTSSGSSSASVSVSISTK